jgi:hypothetical protein
MIEFKIIGPLQVATNGGKGGKGIEKDNCDSFGGSHSKVVDGYGIYIYCISAGGSLKPWYVGKATKTFDQEVFTPDKLNKYNSVLRKIERGKPNIFFVCAPKKRGKKNDKVVGLIEKKMIELCAETNPELLNRHNNKPHLWSIKGVLRSPSRGKPLPSVAKFRQVVSLN